MEGDQVAFEHSVHESGLLCSASHGTCDICIREGAVGMLAKEIFLKCLLDLFILLFYTHGCYACMYVSTPRA